MAEFDLESLRSSEPELPPVTPGFFDLDALILDEKSLCNIDQIIAALDIRLDKENQLVHLALRNLKYVIMCQDRKGRLEAGKRLSALNVANPDHLNTLANLEHVYKLCHRRADAKACRDRLDELLDKRKRKYEILKAQCLLEQGYVYTVLYHEAKGVEMVKGAMDSVTKRLEGLRRNCRDSRAETSIDGVLAEVSILTCDLLSIEDSKVRKAFNTNECLKNYEVGLEMLMCQPGTELEVQLWNYYQALINYNMANLTSLCRAGEAGIHRKKAALLFLRVYKELDQDIPESMMYRARSLGYLGHLLASTFEGKGDTYKDTLETFTITTAQLGGVSSFLYEKARSYCPEDHVILTTEANFMLHKALNKTQNLTERKRQLDRANIIVSRSLSNLSDYYENSLAYSVRRDINYHLSQLAPNMGERYLRQARSDGEVVLLSGGVADLVTMGMICHLLAQSQPQSRRLSSIADKDDVLYEGIDYIQQAIEKGAQDQSKLKCYETLASSLFQLKSYREAVECLKRVIENDTTRNVILFKTFCTYFFELYKDAGKNGRHVLQEFVYWLCWCADKFGQDDVINNFAKCTKEYFTEMVAVIEVLTSSIHGNGGGNHVCMIEKLKQKLEKVRSNESKKRNAPPRSPKSRFRFLLRSPHDKSRTIGEKERTPTRSIGQAAGPVSSVLRIVLQLPGMMPQYSGTYDYIVMHSMTDINWVMYVLRPSLEESFGVNKIRGYLAGRDFVASSGIWEPLRDKVATKVILVLSMEFMRTEWTYAEEQTDIMRLLEEKSREGNLVPLLLDSPCKIPERLRWILGLSWRTPVGPYDWDQVRRYLV
ncbi:uncharacterized protein LOC110454496 [Mizuhopecten yessoensis]|uniref:Uncharacterized protein n=1 Tax=Mizuhopecten yessoensis TaxID=6573 RepID=A0A210QF47_MIZYE|nr:uncharacterized protein LOC110454496 [Mizuhopecten yessoensis]OWF47329.1 hypothetical protein KP79_PYT22611 [Mizuhopecten yessoensis]